MASLDYPKLPWLGTGEFANSPSFSGIFPLNEGHCLIACLPAYPCPLPAMADFSEWHCRLAINHFNFVKIIVVFGYSVFFGADFFNRIFHDIDTAL